MKRTNIYLSDEQLRLLRRLSESKARPVASLVRDALASWLEGQGVRAIPEDEWRARFDALLGHRRQVAATHKFDDDELARDVKRAVREVRGARPARRRR